jgi:hypothetical protein
MCPAFQLFYHQYFKKTEDGWKVGQEPPMNPYEVSKSSNLMKDGQEAGQEQPLRPYVMTIITYIFSFS